MTTTSPWWVCPECGTSKPDTGADAFDSDGEYCGCPTCDTRMERHDIHPWIAHARKLGEELEKLRAFTSPGDDGFEERIAKYLEGCKARAGVSADAYATEVEGAFRAAYTVGARYHAKTGDLTVERDAAQIESAKLRSSWEDCHERLTAARAERDALRTEVERLKDAIDQHDQGCQVVVRTLNGAQAQLAKARKALRDLLGFVEANKWRATEFSDEVTDRARAVLAKETK